ncbi:MAG: carbonic anhydrase family protein [Gammaproteobacteria bacterium]|nr:carbonic anhydrase family protein [Gammaproteobacteria bacterium]
MRLITITASALRKKMFAYGSVLATVLVLCLPIPVSAAGALPHFCYDDAQSCGPSYWGALADEWKTCSLGQAQSPVNITYPQTYYGPGPIMFNWAPTPLTIKNNGHTLQVNYAPGSYIRVNGVTYNLLQFHFHAPSEHTLSGAAADMEAHFVHVSDQGALAVVSVMMRGGWDNPLLGKILANAPAEGTEVTIAGVRIDANYLLPRSREYFTYLGSLTTPPCTEGVRWLVMEYGVDVGTTQAAEFEHLFHGSTARPVQPLNGRSILTGGGGHH